LRSARLSFQGVIKVLSQGITFRWGVQDLSSPASLQAIVHGQVQGVFFRAFVSQKAAELGLTGYVRNLSSGREVEVRAEGERDKLDRLVDHLKAGPPNAKVERVSTNWSRYTGRFSGFEIKY